MSDRPTDPRFSASVIIPTFNRAHFLPKAIDSCLAEQREGLSVEVVVVDDGSTDGTLGLLAKYGTAIRVIPLGKNQGRNRARNTGLEQATGEYVMFLDSDDFVEVGTLPGAVALGLEQGADLVMGGMRVVVQNASGEYDTLQSFDAPRMEPVLDRLLAGEAASTSQVLYRRSYLEGLWWDESLDKLDDWDWFIRACLRGGKLVRYPHSLYGCVQHEGQGVRASTMLHNAHEHHTILAKLEQALNESGELTDRRRKRLAQYYYKELRVLCLHDRAAFHAAVGHILELDPGFRPLDEEPKRWIRWLCAALGVRRALVLHSWLKRSYHRLRGRASGSSGTQVAFAQAGAKS